MDMNSKIFTPFSFSAAVFMIIVLAFMPFNISAYAQNTATPVASYEDLLKIKENPSGDYILTKDLDLAGKDWIPLEFSGSFDGNGHAILNVTISQPSSATRTTYDGNMKTYDTVFGGFFGILEDGATVSNLKLVNIKANFVCDVPCFIGGIAGYMDKSTIKDCSVSGRLDLATTAKMFGVGGIAGFGNGMIDRTEADMTLVCIDNNITEKDEQFLGGAYAVGYIGLGNCNVKVQGFVSDHGYVHNGGLVGMFALYPAGTSYTSYITDNHIEGKISFFEDNTDRRAYCAEYVGEVLNWSYEWGGCTSEFTRDEHFEYDTTLLPEMCENPQYTKTITESSDEAYGFTTYTCENCGYVYTDNYMLHKSDLEAIQKAQEESLAKEKAEQASQQAQEANTQAVAQSNQNTGSLKIVLFVIIILMVLIVLTVFLVNYRLQRKRRYKNKKSVYRNRKR